MDTYVNVCMYTCMYVFMHACVCVYVCVCIVCVGVSIKLLTICICMYVRMQTYMQNQHNRSSFIIKVVYLTFPHCICMHAHRKPILNSPGYSNMMNTYMRIHTCTHTACSGLSRRTKYKRLQILKKSTVQLASTKTLAKLESTLKHAL
jgi:hypothetical protein